MSNFASRWVATDAVGTLFFSDEQNNVIYKVRRWCLERKMEI